MSEGPEIHVYRKGMTLLPVSEQDQELIEQFSSEAILSLRIEEPRSMASHRLYWAVLKGVVDATGRYLDAEALHARIKSGLGLDGRSTSPKKMSGEKWRAYTQFAYLWIQENELPGMGIDQIAELGRTKLSQREREALDADRA